MLQKIALILVVHFLCSTLAVECPEKEGRGGDDEEDWQMKEFTEFCYHLELMRNAIESGSASDFTIDEKLCEEDIFDPNDLRMLFVLMLMIAYGALLRSIIRVFKLNIPYTVLLMLSGLLIGSLSNNSFLCEYLHTFTAIARIPPKIILFTFLPVLIFESAFSITPHTFMRSIVQILIIALPGMVIATMMTAVVVKQFFTSYNWDIETAALFGSIVSATDPVAVVAILRELGASEMLSVMIEGESLLNDGVAILLYEILESIITCEVDDALWLFILRKMFRITLGGPVFGFVIGKIAVVALSLIFNDATVEITITLVAAYLTYYIGEDILGVSGVMAVVVLGITMGSERTSISPEVENFVHHFWEMLGYFANTVLFMIVGIVITETAITKIDVEDYVYLLFLYISLNIIRFLMLLIMYPFVSRIGYGLTWQNMIVMMWGGLRGAVGICLALDIYDNKILCQRSTIGPKFLFQTAGIVFLTLVVNGTTTKMLLQVLKLSDISAGRIQDMANAMKQLEMAQHRTIGMLKHDRFVADANWHYVTKFTTIVNPYKKSAKTYNEIPRAMSLVSVKVGPDDHHTECPECHHVVQNEPTTQEFMDMTEEARLRIIKALKVSCWRQFEQGVLVELAVLQLVNLASAAEDKPFRLVQAHDLRKFWHIHGCLPWLKTKFVKTFGLDDEVLPKKPRQSFRRALWWLATRTWFEAVIVLFIITNMIPAIWETVYLIEYGNNDEYEEVFFALSVFFNIVYVLEAVIKIVGRGSTDYFCTHKANWLDILVIFLGILDIVLYLLNQEAPSVFVYIKVIRVARAVRLLKPLVPRFMLAVDRKINTKLFLGYDIGKGFMTAVDDVIKFLPQMVDHPKVLHKLKHALERERLEAVREMGIMQKEHPGIAIAVKTRHASRAVLNQMRENLLELKADGLVDEKECDLLMVKLEENMKRLWKTPPSIDPPPPELLLENISWIGGTKETYDFFHAKAELLSFSFNDTICKAHDKPSGIFIITSGMVKINYIPTEEIIYKFDTEGEIPCMELFLDITFQNKEDDFFSTGTVIGEQGVLTNQRRAATVKCETSVFAYHISMPVILEALEKFDDHYSSLESSMWRAVGIRLAMAFLPKHPNYASWAVDKIRLHLERSCVPLGERFNSITVYDYIADILIIQGKVKDAFSDDTFSAPQLVPRGVSKIKLIHTPTLQTRVLVIAFEDVSETAVNEQDSSMSLLKHIEASGKKAKKTRESQSYAGASFRASVHKFGGIGESALKVLRSKNRISTDNPEKFERSEVGSWKNVRTKPRKGKRLNRKK
ncbi:unnamed protein product [Allacma fusca]|uniref:Cyclic nucleotide-binding domain-containing protein n=1 Tax=Allacma fusca TaxID=39272 RepID=A0A8J2P7P1_9HEXA|nr:unnamed protein product [Allacma fusca]